MIIVSEIHYNDDLVRDGRYSEPKSKVLEQFHIFAGGDILQVQEYHNYSVNETPQQTAAVLPLARATAANSSSVNPEQFLKGSGDSASITNFCTSQIS